MQIFLLQHFGKTGQWFNYHSFLRSWELFSSDCIDSHQDRRNYKSTGNEPSDNNIVFGKNPVTRGDITMDLAIQREIIGSA